MAVIPELLKKNCTRLYQGKHLAYLIITVFD